MQPSSVTDLLYKQLGYRAERQKVISSNIANIDTPKYKTKEVSFQEHLDKSQFDIKLAVTNNRHIQMEPTPPKSSYSMYEVQGLKEQNDGNNVDLDTQMGEQSKNNTLFTAIQNSLKKDSTWFKLMVDSSGKN